MSDKIRSAKILVGLAVFLTAVLTVSAIWFALSIRQPQDGGAARDSALLTEFDVEEIARAWTANNIGGAAGDELAEFIAKESNTAQPEMLSEYLKTENRLESATTWNYGPTARTGENRYETTATAMTRVHDTMETALISIDEPEGAPEETLASDDFAYTSVVKMPFSLTVDLESNSVINWKARRDQANQSIRIESERLTNQMTVEELYGDDVAECVNAAARERLPNSAMTTLLHPPDMRQDADAARLKTAIAAAGLGEVCEHWLGE